MKTKKIGFSNNMNNEKFIRINCIKYDDIA